MLFDRRRSRESEVSRVRGRRGALLAAALLVLLPPARAGDTTLVSAATDGTPGDAASGSVFGRQSVSASGRFVSFESLAADLVAQDTNGAFDVFVRDRKQGTTVRASVALDGDPAGGGGLNANLSANGRFVVFQSAADDLVPDDGNFASDIFVRDLKQGVTTRVSVDSAGLEGDASSFNPAISANGRYVVFQSDAANLAPDDDNIDVDVFLHDRKQGTTVRVSLDSSGAGHEGDSLEASVSANGRFVAFESVAAGLVEGDLNGVGDVFVRDLKLGTTLRLSLSQAGVEGDGASFSPMISAKGRHVVFASVAGNLVDGDGDAFSDVFVRDLKLGTLERLSVDAAGAGVDGSSGVPWITPGGRCVAFESHASNLVEQDRNAAQDVFLADRKLGTLRRVSVAANGAEIGGNSARCAVSSNGRFIAFDCDDDDLVPDDDNTGLDVFLRDAQD